jgi:tRNA(Ile2) C34 agmatinyltransferase TiaS
MIYIGLDDTDNLDSSGTGHLARALVDALRDRYDVFGITRHQLLRDSRVPCTKNNSSATVHLREKGPVDVAALGDFVAAFVQEHSFPGSDPGVCVVSAVPAAVSAFGRRVQSELVCRADALALAGEYGLYLRGLGGTEDGVIGALASVGLAATGNDGRFILVGTIRALSGVQPIDAVLAAGISAVRTLEGEPVTAGLVVGQAAPIVARWAAGAVCSTRRRCLAAAQT